jgi:hypothetical protein
MAEDLLETGAGGLFEEETDRAVRGMALEVRVEDRKDASH